MVALRSRAALYAALRTRFAERGVMEVETPLLASSPVTDPHIDAIATANPLSGDHPFYLQTSPEYAMKRLLAAGSGAIFQICKAFRGSEHGARHNPEFTMLEWYEPGVPLESLMDEVAAVIRLAVGDKAVEHMTYRSAFLTAVGLDPHTASLDALRDCASQHMDINFESDERDTWLQLIMSAVVEPSFDGEAITFVVDFPESQAALANIAIDAQGQSVARRFEAFCGGLELANGYDELRDAGELLRRIRRDHQQRKASGQTLPPIDRNLLSAMQAGLPDCCGVAVGLDRLLMLATSSSRIDEVVAFPLDRV